MSHFAGEDIENELARYLDSNRLHDDMYHYDTIGQPGPSQMSIQSFDSGSAGSSEVVFSGHLSSPSSVGSDKVYMRQRVGRIPPIGQSIQSADPVQSQERQERFIYQNSPSPHPNYSNNSINVTPTYYNSLNTPNTTTNNNTAHLIPVSALDGVYASVFTFKHFNNVQSECFEAATHSLANFVVSAPTGCGKTGILELAIVQMLEHKRVQMPATTARDRKAIYLAPTRALCSEKARDWQAKFADLKVAVKEITGDMPFDGHSNMMDFIHADIVVTTPEKWDSLTRRWNDNPRLFSQIRLVMIDEVHLLHESRGSTLEVLVSRMRMLGDDIRYIAISATAPNASDIANWLSDNRGKSATLKEFDESYRPVQIARHVYPFKRNNNNDFAFDSLLNFKLFDKLAAHMEGKPALVFCPTRKSVSKAAETLVANFETVQKRGGETPWHKPTLKVSFKNTLLQRITPFGVAVHHAGIDSDDRRLVEQLFLQGVIRVVVSTTTLAQGVNLPCRTIVIKGTRFYSNGGWKELSELDVLQMIGRAGRPQHDTSGTAIIMTDQAHFNHYKSLVNGETPLESSLHLNLCEHLNAEINLGTIASKEGAVDWLRKSFLYVRIQKNPNYYRDLLNQAGDRPVAWEKRLEEIVENGVNELCQHGLVEMYDDGKLRSTGFGNIMSKDFIRFKTFKQILGITAKPSVQDLLLTLCAADEMKDITLRAGEKKPLSDIKALQDIRYPPAKMAQAADKISVLLQATLAGVDLHEFRSDEFQPFHDSITIFKQSYRVAKAIIGVGIEKKDSVIIRNAGFLFRSVASKAWEDRSVTLRQIDEIGLRSIKIFTCKGINSIEKLSHQDPGYIQLLLNRNPPFGNNVVAAAKSFPKFTIAVDEQYLLLHQGTKPVQAVLKLSIGVANAGKNMKVKTRSNSSLHASIVVWNSDDELIDFKRIQVKALLEEPRSFEIKPDFASISTKLFVQVSCDECAGLQEVYEYKPQASAAEFPKAANIDRAIDEALNGALRADLGDDLEIESSDEDLVDLTDAAAMEAMMDAHVNKYKEKTASEAQKHTSATENTPAAPRKYGSKRSYEQSDKAEIHNNHKKRKVNRNPRLTMDFSDEEDELE